MGEPIIHARWVRPEWIAEAHRWIAGRIAELGARRTGDITQPHIRPWATALRVPTDIGPLWFKATVPTLAHESAITHALSVWAPGRTPEVLASDAGRNWLLMTDGGDRLRSLPESRRDPQVARELASVYAGLQRDVAHRAEAMLALGVPDCRSASMPKLFEELLNDREVLRIGQDEGLTAGEYAQLKELTPRVMEITRELIAFGIPETLQHDDLHWNNVLVRDSRMLIFDWGDSSVAHPFLSLTVLLRFTARHLKVEENDPVMCDIRDAYLDAWALPLTRAERRRACQLADALGRISRALTYHRLLPGLEVPHRSEFTPSVAGWLQELLAWST